MDGKRLTAPEKLHMPNDWSLEAVINHRVCERGTGIDGVVTSPMDSVDMHHKPAETFTVQAADEAELYTSNCWMVSLTSSAIGSQ
jgi:hypothetical protein